MKSPGLQREGGHKFSADVGFCLDCGAWNGELGLEPELGLYIKHLCDIFDEIKRVLKKTGTCWVVMGDTFLGDSPVRKSTREQFDPDKQAVLKRSAGGTRRSAQSQMNVKPKSLCLIPSRFAIEMCNRGWTLRNEIVWHKPNCMPSSAKDRFTVDFERLLFFTKSRKYYFEQQFEAYTGPINRWGGRITKNCEGKQRNYVEMQGIGSTSSMREGGDLRPNPHGRNRRCVWRVPTQPWPGLHYAVFPEKLAEIPIKAGCPLEVCVKCGRPREKVYSSKFIPQEDVSVEKGIRGHGNQKPMDRSNKWQGFPRGRTKKQFAGYSSCSCGAGWRRGTVLDPFAGSGTTCVVARKLGREFIGIEVNPEYCRMAEKRISSAGTVGE